ncbi:inositol 1,4,5-trisphosphate receptor-interacting protein isoform X2 [Hemitrygon akajei]
MPAPIITVWLLVSAILSEPPPAQREALGRMEEREAELQAQKLRLERELDEAAPVVVTAEEPQAEDGDSWGPWGAYPLAGVLLLLLALWGCGLVGCPRALRLLVGGEAGPESGELPPLASLPDLQALACFYEQSVRLPADEVSRTREMVEGFADDLLEAVRSVCDRELDMELQECVGVGSLYENWRLDRPLACDLLVPFSPPEPYRFQAELMPAAGPEFLTHGAVRVLGPEPGACRCGDTQLARDMLCLVHGEQDPAASHELLWAPTAPYLSRGPVMRWFQAALTKAWARISHKYDFELGFQDLERPGSLRIRFRSGKVVLFHLCPVVQYEGSDMYLTPAWDSPEAQPGRRPDHGTVWELSTAVYEKRFLNWVGKRLPLSPCHLACLQIAAFLHQKQIRLSGPGGLRRYHLKTALLHLLARLPPAAWHRSCLPARLRDLLELLQLALRHGRLQHFILGSGSALPQLNIPAGLRSAQQPNLLAGLAARRQLLARARHMLAEMQRNATVLVREYGPPETQTSHASS